MSKLERVLKQVAHGREEKLAVGVDGEFGIDVGNSERAFADLSFERRGELHFRDEIGQGKEPADHGDAGVHPRFGERAIDQFAQADQAAVEDGAGCAGQADGAGLDGGKGEGGAVEMVAQLVREKSEALIRARVFVGEDVVALGIELGGGDGDGVVETAVEGAEFIVGKRRAYLDGEIGDGLAKIAVIVHDLFDGETVLQELAAMLLRAQSHFGQAGLGAAGRTGHALAFPWLGRFLGLKGPDDLVEKEGDAEVELGFGGFGRGPARYFHSAALDELAPIFRQEFMHHNDWCDWVAV